MSAPHTVAHAIIQLEHGRDLAAQSAPVEAAAAPPVPSVPAPQPPPTLAPSAEEKRSAAIEALRAAIAEQADVAAMYDRVKAIVRRKQAALHLATQQAGAAAAAPVANALRTHEPRAAPQPAVFSALCYEGDTYL